MTTTSEPSDDMLTDVETLLAIREIEQLKYRYCRCVDLKDFEALRTVLTPDAVAEYSGGKYRFDGADEIIAFLTRNLSRTKFLTSHHMHHPEITIVDQTNATGVWAMNDVNLDDEWDFFLQGAGYYDDRYVRTAEGWRIASTGYRRTFEIVGPLSAAPHTVTASLWGTDGQSSLDPL